MVPPDCVELVNKLGKFCGICRATPEKQFFPIYSRNGKKTQSCQPLWAPYFMLSSIYVEIVNNAPRFEKFFARFSPRRSCGIID
jgi:hypothetical protein